MGNENEPQTRSIKEQAEPFDMSPYTSSPLRMEATVEFQGMKPNEVFDILGDPDAITQWYPLAKSVKMYPAEDGNTENDTFTVDFLFFGEVFEEILFWDYPYRYVYQAKGDGFPIKDYIACIEIRDLGEDKGLFTWKIYCNNIEGTQEQIVMPLILPPITSKAMENLSPLINGVAWDVKSYF
jgi:hypothetical protein